uniref:deoxyribonuclease-2-alpha-like n=1 Tax=Myxine glutinosa TaxID=7769 RepID=UPI00358EC861
MSPMRCCTLVTLLLSFCNHALTFSCKNSAGQNVDWFIVYKLPKTIDVVPDVPKGKAFLYMDMVTGTWTRSVVPIDAETSPIRLTLTPLQQLHKKQNDSMAYVLYNDQPPTNITASNSLGHTKGVVVVGKSSGFWLVHSTPDFPPKAGQPFVWPHTALHYGQSFLCVSFDFHQFPSIGSQLLCNEPHVYDSAVPPSFLPVLSSFEQVAKEQWQCTPIARRNVSLSSRAGQHFVSFAKSRHFDDDLYSGFVAPTLGVPLYVESWRNSPHVLNSNCSAQFPVFNVKTVDLLGQIEFHTTQDHCKWCVAQSDGGMVAPWVCVGDVNRIAAEMKRGGGTLCLSDPAVWKAFYNAVNDYEKCD